MINICSNKAWEDKAKVKRNKEVDSLRPFNTGEILKHPYLQSDNKVGTNGPGV